MDKTIDLNEGDLVRRNERQAARIRELEGLMAVNPDDWTGVRVDGLHDVDGLVNKLERQIGELGYPVTVWTRVEAASERSGDITCSRYEPEAMLGLESWKQAVVERVGGFVDGPNLPAQIDHVANLVAGHVEVIHNLHERLNDVETKLATEKEVE